MSIFRRASTSGSGTPVSSLTSDALEPEWATGDRGSILVAVDGKPGGWDALEWAAAEAASRHCLLRIIHVIHSSPAFVGTPMDFYVDDQCNVRAIETAQRILGEAETRARLVAPEIEVSVCPREGSPTATILQEGKRDALVVLGRGRTGNGIRSAISVGRRVTRRATSPVATVTLGDSEHSGRSAGRVVVGLDGTENPLDVLGFAFRSAQKRGIGVTLIYASPAMDLSNAAPSISGSIQHSVRLCQEAYPEVELRLRIGSRCSSSWLIAESAGAALLVIGTDRRRSRRVAFGLPRHGALQLAQIPVAIVRPLRDAAVVPNEVSE